MPIVHINGKWLGQPFTGVQRYSDEVSRRVVCADGIDWVLHVPRGDAVPGWAGSSPVTVRRAPVGGVVFEQFYLPIATRRQLLLNFGGVAPLCKRRQSVTFHDATPFRFPSTYRRLFVAFYFVAYFLLSRTARRVNTVSEFSRKELSSVLRRDIDRFHLAPCAAGAIVSVDPIEPEMPDVSNAYLVVGTFALHKNLMGPIRALAGSGRRVVVVGAATDDKVFARSDEAFGDNVVVAKRLTDAELAWLYRRVKALVFPSRYEGFGLPVLEAQALGCPVIASDAASIPEVGGNAAIYFDPDDVGDLIRAVDEFENSFVLQRELIEKGMQNSSRYSWELTAESVVGWVRGGEW